MREGRSLPPTAAASPRHAPACPARGRPPSRRRPPRRAHSGAGAVLPRAAPGCGSGGAAGVAGAITRRAEAGGDPGPARAALVTRRRVLIPSPRTTCCCSCGRVLSPGFVSFAYVYSGLPLYAHCIVPSSRLISDQLPDACALAPASKRRPQVGAGAVAFALAAAGDVLGERVERHAVRIGEPFRR